MAPVLFQIMSDLHLETHPLYDYQFKQRAPYLALLGDIGLIGDDRLFHFLEKQVKRYWAVFFLLGNHEPSGLSFDAAKKKVVLCFSIKLDTTCPTLLRCWDVRFFSHIVKHQEAAVASRLTDFRKISEWSVHDHNRAHHSDLDWLNQQVLEISQNEPNRNIAIFTHHSPCTDERAIDPKHVGSEVMSGFVTDLKLESCWSSSKVKAWAFGHTHYNTSFTNENGAKILTNQKGYYMLPAESFQPDRVYTLGE